MEPHLLTALGNRKHQTGDSNCTIHLSLTVRSLDIYALTTAWTCPWEDTRTFSTCLAAFGGQV